MIENVLRAKTPDEIQDLEDRGFRKGDSKWKFKIDISLLLDGFEKANQDNTSPSKESIEYFIDGMVSLLEKKIEDIKIYAKESSFNQFVNLIESFKSCKDKDINDIDNTLDEFYNWADDNNVWIEASI